MKKKIAMLTLALCMTMVLAGCGGTKDKTEKTDTAKTEKADGKKEVRALDLDKIKDYVTLGKYKDLEGEKTVVTITDKDVDAQIKGALSYTPVEVTDRPAQEGDTVNINYVGTIDGVEFEGGKAENHDLRIGSNSFIEGFETGLIGATKGQTLDVNTTFPAEYPQNPDLAGKEAIFNVTVNSISKEAELNDEWVAANSKYKTVQEYRDALKELLEKSAVSQSENELKATLFKKVVDDSKVKDCPEEFVKKEEQSYRDQIENTYAKQAKMTLDEFIKAQGYTEEQFNTLVTEQTKQRLNQKAVVQAILDAEKIKITKTEYDKMTEDYAKENGFTDAKTMIDGYGEETVKDAILWSKAGDILLKNAKITEKQASETQAPAGEQDTKTEDTTAK